jgi:hypothetical protein
MIQFKVVSSAETRAKRNAFEWNRNPSSHFQPPEHLPLRKPYFNFTLAEFEASQAASGVITSDATLDRLFAIIDEVNAASFEVASFSELNTFVNEKLVTYGEKWQRRTIKIVERVQQARNVAGAAWNYTQSMLKTFNATLKDSVLKTSEKIGDLRELLTEQSESGIDEGQGIRHIASEVNDSILLKVVRWGMGIEIVAFFCFIIVALIPAVRESLTGVR